MIMTESLKRDTRIIHIRKDQILPVSSDEVRSIAKAYM